jgi:AcrR family transcriptional regulator
MPKRVYRSSVRVAHVAQTRERLLDACREHLLEHGLDGLTLPRVAELAEVAVPTVYRHFATFDELIAALLEWIRPQLGQDLANLTSYQADDLHRLPLDNFPRFEANARVLLALMESRQFNRVRTQQATSRASQAADLLTDAAPGWPRAELGVLAGAIYLLATPVSWRWLRETWKLSTKDAARASSWAIGALIAALAEGPPPKARRPARRRKIAT